MGSTNPERIRVLIVDDHQVVRLGLRTLLDRFPQLEVVGEAATAADALKSSARLTPDLILLDIRLPDSSGLGLCRQLKNQGRRVLVLTSHAEDRTVLEAIAAGADGYLLKEIDGDQLVRAIETIATGSSVLDPAVTRAVLSAVRARTDAPPENQPQKLSEQEQRVLALVAEGKTNKEIAVQLQLSDKTVKNYFSSVLNKLGLSRRSQAAAFFARQTGQ